MSIWNNITETLTNFTGPQGLTSFFSSKDASTENNIGFTIAVIALSAKMAKADGLVTKDEVQAFREVFHIRPADEKNAAKLYNLAKKDVAGYESYAKKIARTFSSQPEVLEDVTEGLFFIAMADGQYHPKENDFIHQVAILFGISDPVFKSIRARFVQDAPRDPYEILGVTRDMDYDDIRVIWRNKVRESHPDQMMARGLPEEAINMATKKLISINAAWHDISASHTH